VPCDYEKGGWVLSGSKKRGLRVPIKAAKSICEDNLYDHVVMLFYDSQSGRQCVTTWGKTSDMCSLAADQGNAVKEYLGWPSHLCDAQPSRVQSLKKRVAELEAQLRELGGNGE